MSTEEMEEFELDGENVEVVRDFDFLGAKIEDSGSCKGEILRLLALGRAAMTGLNQIWKDKDITITKKCRIVGKVGYREHSDYYEHPPRRLIQTSQVPLPVFLLKYIVCKPPGTSKSFVLPHIFQVKIV